MNNKDKATFTTKKAEKSNMSINSIVELLEENQQLKVTHGALRVLYESLLDYTKKLENAVDILKSKCEFELYFIPERCHHKLGFGHESVLVTQKEYELLKEVLE